MTDIVFWQGTLPAFSVRPQAISMKEKALELSALIGKVETPEQQNEAVNAQVEIKRLIKTFEEARVAVTKPLLEMQRAVKASVDVHAKELDCELMRLGSIVGDYQTALLAAARAAESLKNEELTRIEKERESMLAKAKDLSERDAIQENADFKVREVQFTAPSVTIERSAHQHIRQDWEIKIVSLDALYKAHPQAVKMEARLQEVRMLLDAGITPAGVQAKRVTKAGVRV